MTQALSPSTDPSPRLRIGVCHHQEELSREGFLFSHPTAYFGGKSLRPWHDLHAAAAQQGIDFLTIDQVQAPHELDAVIFVDRPAPGRPGVDALMQAPIKKYLLLLEPEPLRPDNWEPAYHQQFHRIFTWNDDLADGERYLKIQVAADLRPPYDFSALKARFERRKLASMVARAKQSPHEQAFYPERERAVHWFEHNAPDDFDLYGLGWDAAAFPAYRGPVQDKQATLAHYRFVLCMENICNVPGYITEMLTDALRAGTVPVYAGAPNVHRWLPADCFIDMRTLGSYTEMHRRLKQMSAEEHGAYLDRIQRFLNSPGAYPFSSECFVDTLLQALGSDLRGQTSRAPSLALAAAAAAEATAGAPWSAPAGCSDEQRRQSIRQAGRPDLIVYFGYGNELPVYTRARTLWQYYLSHFPGIRPLFVRTSKALPPGAERLEDGDLVIGAASSEPDQTGNAFYVETGSWSPTQNQDTIFRQQAVYKYLLRENPGPFFLYQTTVTSVIDFRGLMTALQTLPSTGCFSGFPGRVSSGTHQGTVMLHGANTCLSSDMMRCLVERYDREDPLTQYPNDHWQAYTLSDVKRYALPLFSFNNAYGVEARRRLVPEVTRRMLENGHFHFRIKTCSSEAGLGPREDIDPWVMLAVMDTILHSPYDPVATHDLLVRLQDWIQAPGDGIAQPPFSAKSIYRGPRRFALNDEDTDSLFRDLADIPREV